MKSISLTLLLSGLLLAASARAQWQTTTYALKGGWNAIYLTGDARQDTLDNLFPAQVTEVWRWNSNPSQVQFTDSPLIPSAGTPEWSVWRRGLPDQSTFSKLTGQSAYLVKCTGTTANNYNAAIKQSPVMPTAAWVRDGANLLGFPSLKNGSSFPTFSSYFAPFPAVIAANLKIFKYVGGDLGAANPLQVFSAASEQLDRSKAYWFSAEVGGEYYAPVEVSVRGGQSLDFGRSGTIITVAIRNRTAGSVNVRFAEMPSESAPAGQVAIAGRVPLTRHDFDPVTLTTIITPIALADTVSVPAQGSVELQLGIDRSLMTGAANSLYASLLRVTDSANLMELYLPLRAEKTSPGGLWLGDIEITNVSNKVSNGAVASAGISSGKVSGITVSSGGFGYSSAPPVTIEAPVSGVTATATAVIAGGAVSGVFVTNGGSGYTRVPKISFGPPPVLTGTSLPGSSRFRLRTLLHATTGGSATLLSQAFVGQLNSVPHDVGICTDESLLKQDAKATAQRFVSAHLPLNQIISCSGAVTGTLTCTVTVPANDPTNPFVHQYHPDHDNKDARGAPLPAGDESYDITRTCSFSFTSSPPPGSTVTNGWGTTVLGGTYREIISGIHKNPLQVDGTFELRRASEIGILTSN